MASDSRLCRHCGRPISPKRLAARPLTSSCLIGADGRKDLEELEIVLRLMPAPAEDKAASIDAVHALLATLPQEGA